MTTYTHRKIIRVPIYDGLLIMIFSNSNKDVKKLIGSLNEDEPFAHAHMINWQGKQGYVVALNFHNSSKGISPGTITHESIHIAHYVAQRAGILADFDNDEALAYLAEWITDEIYKFKNECKL